jgi:uncharacterized membrane protein YjgN (DUF898 family)
MPGEHVDTDAPSRGIEAFALRFTGTGGEYFRVWIVNVLLSIVTLGFYTPFARRRTAQYFFSHTDVAGSPLEFTAQQRKMVIGFLVLVGLYIAFKVASETGQNLTVALFMLGGAALAPYFWASAMRFRLSATRWRGLRLQFAPSWGEVYKASWPVFVVALLWIGVSFAAGVLIEPVQTPGRRGLPRFPNIPTAFWLLVAGAVVGSILCVIRLEFNYKSLLVRRARIGGEVGHWKPVYGDFVRIWLATVGVLFLSLLGMLAIFVALAFAVGFSLRDAKALDPGAIGILLIVLVPLALLVLLLVAIAPVRAYREARMFQLVWNNVGVSTIARFKCDLSAWRYVVLRIRNVLLTLFTLGLWRPFARVSEHRMKTQSVTLHVKGGLDQLMGRLTSQQGGGVGDALADAVGLDLVG